MDDKNNIFVIGLDMEDRSAEDIAKDAALKIGALFDELIKKQDVDTTEKKEDN